MSFFKRTAKFIADRSARPFFNYWSGLSYEMRVRDVQSSIRQELESLRRELSATTPGNPCIFGFKAFSQTDEDGIFEHIFDKLPGHSRTFIEIGCGRGIENNTHYLALKGYSGVWVDGNEANISFIEEGLGGSSHEALLIERQFISVENIGDLLNRYCKFLKLPNLDVGLFSLDIDGNDLHVMREAIKYISPLVICAEYNPKFPPPLSITVPYKADRTWPGGDYHGASLQAFCDLLSDYKLVACNLAGANAFFVRSDRADEFPEHTPKQLYQPFRENLIQLRSEHLPSLKWLSDKLNENVSLSYGGGPQSGVSSHVVGSR